MVNQSQAEEQNKSVQDKVSEETLWTGETVEQLTWLHRSGYKIQVLPSGGKRSKQIDVSKVDPVTGAPDWEGLLKAGESLELNLLSDPGITPQLVCIDIDDQKGWDRLTQPDSLRHLGKCLVIFSNRGGHLIYKKGPEKAAKNTPKAFLNCGIHADYIRNKVIIAGEGRGFIGYPTYPAHLDSVPFSLQIAKDKRESPLNEDGIIPEGTRNSTLLGWISQITAPQEDMELLVTGMNAWFCSPPMSSEECETISMSTEGKVMVLGGNVDYANSNEEIFL